jgi:hypothetical protein
MSLETIRRVLVAGSAAIMLVCGFGVAASAQDASSFFPAGVKQVSVSTGWTNGGGQPHWCAAMANQHFPGKPFYILSSSEEMMWDNEFLRIGPHYKYHCNMLIRES